MKFPVMAHLHEKIDFTVAIFVVHDGRVLLIHHRKLDQWLPLGGHIELEEDPEAAALFIDMCRRAITDRFASHKGFVARALVFVDETHQFSGS